eukprot:g20802.t1
MAVTATAAPAEAAALARPDPIDSGIAIFLVVSGVGVLVVSSLAMVLFFRERAAFEIRARSSFLSLLNGLCFLTVLMLVVTNQLQERNYVIVCLVLGAASTAVPLYDMTRVSDGPLADLEYLQLVWYHLWIVVFSTQGIVLLLNPIAWMIDDIFGIGPELRVMMAVQVICMVTGRVGEEYGYPELLRWIETGILGFISAVIMVFITIISPITRRLLRPLEASDPKVVKALRRRKAFAARTGSSVGSSTSDRTLSTDEDYDTIFRASKMPTTGQPSSAPSSSPRDSWTYERVMKTPEISAAFEAFSQKALCQESFLFLKDATKFQNFCSVDVEANFADDDKTDFADDVKTNDEDGKGHAAEDSEGRRSGKSGEDIQDQFKLFSKIVREYIVDGAPNEINISWKDKSDILELYNGKRPGELRFRDLPASERRVVFSRAYAEIRFVLESNLMLKFISTPEFDKALAAARQQQANCC